MKIKKFLWTALLCMCFSLIACGNNESVETPEKQQVANMSNEPDEQISSGDEKHEEMNSIEGPITVEVVKGYKVAEESDFTFTEFSDTVQITKYVGNDEIVVVPETIKGKNVTEILGYTFGNESKVRGLCLPSSIKHISDLTVNNQVIEIVICEGVETVGNYCFISCPKLTTVVFGDSVKDLGNVPFGACPALNEVYVPSSQVYLEEYKIPNLFVDLPDVTVYGIAGSSMEEYAKQNNVKFVAQ